MSSGSLGGGMGSGTAGAHGRCPRSLRGPAIGLVTLSALAVAVPTGAQTVTVPSAPTAFRAFAGDGRVRLAWRSPSDLGGVAAATLTYQYRYAPGAAVPETTAWSPPEGLPPYLSVILAGFANGTAYAFEVRAANTAGAGPAATAMAAPQRVACPAPALGDRRQIWRAALTIGAAPALPAGDAAAGEVLYFGYDVSAWDGSTVGTLSDTGFRVGATRYSIGEVLAYNPHSSALFSGSFVVALLYRDLSPAHRAALRLHVCGTAYDFSPDYVFKPEYFVSEANEFEYAWVHGSTDTSGLYPDHLDWGLLVDRTVYLSLPANTPATGKPTVTGKVQVGRVLTAAKGTIADADKLTLAEAGEVGFGYTYQWVRVDADGMSNPADIPGATGATYTATASDVGKRLKVRVSFTDDLNSAEARESDGTAGNSVPTASDGRVIAIENQDYTFTAADFNFSDSDGDPLASVTIKVRPASGTLKLDNANVRVDATVTKAQLDAGSLTYTPPTDQTGTGVAFFYFAVSDGIAESTSVYRMTIDIAEDTIAPGRPRNLTAVPGNGAVALRWEAPLSPGSSAIVRYEVRHAARDAVPPATAWESVGLNFTHTVTGLADGQRHTFEVRALNSSSPSESSAAEATATPSATLTPSVSMEEVEVRVAEDAGTAVVTVLLDRPSTAALTVPWYTADDTAVSPDDYIGGQGSVTFAPGETRNTISVRIVDDALREDPVDGRHEQFLVLPSRGDGYRLKNGGEALSVVIEDNDGDGPVTRDDTRPPLLTQATVDGRTLVLTYDEALDGASVPAPGDFTVTAAGSTVNVSGASVAGSTVTLTLATAVEAGQTVTLDYTPGANPTQDAAGNDAAPLSGEIVTNNTGRPVLTGATVNGSTLTLTYDKALDGASVPAASDFAVTAAGSTVNVSGASVAGSTVTLTLATAVEAGQTVALDYTPGANPIQDAAGNDAVPLSGQTVTNNTSGGGGGPITTPPGAPASLTTMPGDTRVVLTWSAPADDGGAPVTGYEYRSAAGTSVPEDTPWQSAGLSLERTVAELTNGQQYAFEVRAMNSAGPGAAARAAATPLGVPTAPESLTATAGDGEVVLEWAAPADDGGSPVTGYEYRYAAGQAVPEDVTWRDAGTELTATASGLENETGYALEVRARNRVGPGEAAVTTATPILPVAELFSSAQAVLEGESLVIGVRRSGGLAHAAHAYVGVTDSALPDVTATDDGRADGLGRQRLEFAAGAAEATVTVIPAFDGVRRENRVLTATLESVEVEIGGEARAYEFAAMPLEVRVTEGDAELSVADARAEAGSAALVFTVSLDRARDVPVQVDYATEDGSARAGEGYTPVSGTLTIAAGGSEARVEVAVLPPWAGSRRTWTSGSANGSRKAGTRRVPPTDP